MMLADASPWLAVFGRAHFVLLHAPLGLLPALAVLEYGALLLRRTPPRGPVLALAWLAALCGAAGAGSGLVLAGSGGYDHELLEQHKLFGLALGGLCVVAALAAAFANRAPFRIVLALALVAMVPAGHLGGTMTHGDDFLFKPLRRAPAAPATPAPTPTPAPAPAPNAANDPDAAPAAPPPAGPAADSAFARTIQPILARTCTACHNADKQKGELQLDTRAGIERGGENGPVLVPGKPEESPLLTRCELPLDDDDHMPPSDEDQPTAAELAALRWWIAAGAPF
jgi:hypothetical protein